MRLGGNDHAAPSVRDTNKRRVWGLYLTAAVVLFVTATVGIGVHSRMVIGEENYHHALSQHLYYAWEQLIGTVLLLLPFLLLACIAADFSIKGSVGLGATVFVVGAVLLFVLYYKGYVDSEIAMKNKHWTAAALSLGLLPFESLGVVVLLLIGGLIAGKRKNANTEAQ
jgi:hypothetical protein